MPKRMRSLSPLSDDDVYKPKPKPAPPKALPKRKRTAVVPRKEYVLEPAWYYLAVNVFNDNHLTFPVVQGHQTRVKPSPGPSIHLFLDLSVNQYGKYIYEEVHATWKAFETTVWRMSDDNILLELADNDFDVRTATVDFLADEKWCKLPNKRISDDDDLKEAEFRNDWIDKLRRQCFGLDDADFIINWEAPFWKWLGTKFVKQYASEKAQAWYFVDEPLRFAPFFLRSDYRTLEYDEPAWKSVDHTSRWLGYPGDEMDYYDSGRQIPFDTRATLCGQYATRDLHKLGSISYENWVRRSDREDNKALTEAQEKVRVREPEEIENAVNGPGIGEFGDADLVAFANLSIGGAKGGAKTIDAQHSSDNFWSPLGSRLWPDTAESGSQNMDDDVDTCSMAHLCLDEQPFAMDDLIAKMDDQLKIAPDSLGSLLSFFDSKLDLRKDVDKERRLAKRARKDEHIELADFVAPDMIYGAEISRQDPFPETRASKIIAKHWALKYQKTQ